MNKKVIIQGLFKRNGNGFAGFPDRLLAEGFIERLFHFLFSPYHGRFANMEEVEKEYEQLEDQFAFLLQGVITSKAARADVSGKFIKRMPRTYLTLLSDAEAISGSDPAATSVAEVVITYPGFYAMAIYRIAHLLWELEVPFLPRLFTEFAHRQTGIDIHPGAKIGKAFAIDHGTGIVIGETAEIGNYVKIYQGVTLGALNVEKRFANKKRHPTIEDHVVIYAGATILGGQTTIGQHSIIGGNAWLTNSIPPYSVAYQKNEVKVRDKNPFPEPINFII